MITIITCSLSALRRGYNARVTEDAWLYSDTEINNFKYIFFYYFIGRICDITSIIYLNNLFFFF
jgi:hypothetical protein